MKQRSGVNLPRLDDMSAPAWIWDLDRARIADANKAALAFWDEPTLADILAREFDPKGPMAATIEAEAERLDKTPTDTVLPLTSHSGSRRVRCEAAALALPDGRRGVLIKVLGELVEKDADEDARLAFAARGAPVALLFADTSGKISAENEAARALFGEGREPALAQRIGSSRIAKALIEECMVEGRASRTRTIPTRFGMRLCRLTVRRSEDPVSGGPSILVQAVDVEDERARIAEREAEAASLASFLDASADFYLELDYDLRVVRASNQLGRRLNLGETEPQSLHWRQIANFQGVEISREIEKAMEGRTGWQASQIVVLQGEGRKVYTAHGQVLTNERGDFRGYRIVAHESRAPNTETAGVTSISAHRPEKARPPAFADMVDAAPWAVVVHRGFAPLYINRAFMEFFGLEEDTLKAPEEISLITMFPGAEPALREDYDRLMHDELAFAVRELSAHRSIDDREMTLQLRARRIDWQGSPAIEYVMEDVTAYRGIDRSDKGRGQTMTAVLDMMPEAIFMMQGDGRIEWANLAALRLLDLPDAGPAPHDLSDVLGPEDTGWAQDYVAGLAEGGLTHLFAEGREVAVITAGGQRVSALMALERIGEGDTVKVCAVLRDISEWRGAETKLEEARGEAEQSSGRKTEFLAKVSHELRTPLTAILGFAQVMARQELGPIGNPRYIEYAQDILGSGDHLLSLINDLLDMSKVESGKLDLSFDSVDLHDLTEGCVRLMSPIAGSRQVTLRHTVADTLPSVVGDERSLRQILLNLISNALRFTEGGGEVCVNAELDDSGGLTLSVNDTGVGMNEAELAVALEPFEQVEKEVASGTPGTGLGLPLARALTEANRALFRIESAPEAGTRVAITFPSTQVLVV